MTEFNWALFIPRVAVALMMFIFVLAWLAWFWFIVCRPQQWSTWVQREHEVMRRLGLPPRWSATMFRLQTGWFMPAVIFGTTCLAICVLHLL